MTEKGNARHGAGTPKRAKESESAVRADTIARLNFISVEPKIQEISSLLLPGRRNALSRRDLEAMTGLDGRTIRLMIERERREGVPILADNATGYYLPATEHEKAACVRSMRHRAGEIMKTARAIERAKG